MLLSSMNCIDSLREMFYVGAKDPKHMDLPHILCTIHVFLNPGHLLHSPLPNSYYVKQYATNLTKTIWHT